MRSNGNELLDGFQVGAQIGGKIVDGYRQKQEMDYKAKRDAIEDTFKREQLAQQGEDRGLRRQEMGLRMADLSDAMDQRKKERARQAMRETFAAKAEEDALNNKIQNMGVKTAIPQVGVAPVVENDPIVRNMKLFDNVRSQLKNQYFTAQQGGDEMAMQDAAQKISEINEFGKGMMGATIQREAKRKPSIRVKSGPNGNEYEMTGDVSDMSQIEEFTKRFGPKEDPDEIALKWARANPGDPRAAQIKAKLGIK